jgi:hydroxylysine kinase
VAGIPLALIGEHLRSAYGLVGRVSRLPGEHDENFLVSSGEGTLVLRVVAPDQGEDRDRFILSLLDKLHGADVICPVLISATDGSVVPLLRLGAHEPRRSWLTTFVPGTPWVERLDDPAVAFAVGRGLAHLDEGLDCPSEPASCGQTPWDLTRPQGALALIEGVPLGADGPRIRDGLRELEESVLPALGDTPRQPIHNDANPDNVLLTAQGEVGFIDFGDAVLAPRTVELAVTGSYLADIGTPSSLESPLTSLIRGFRSVVPLGRNDLSALPGLMRGRLALALGNALARAHHHPQRARYVLRHAERARRRMEALDALDMDAALKSWETTGRGR